MRTDDYEKKQKFGEVLKQKRMNQNITQRACAEHCKVSVNAYQFWERGNSYPKKDKFESICDFLGIDKEQFV